MSKNSTLLLIILLFSLNLVAQKPMAKRSFEISLEADEKINTEIKDNMRVDVQTGLPVALYGLNYEVPAGTPESMAMYYLEHESKKLGISANEIVNLRHHATRTTNAGSVVRYRQYSGEYPVNKAEVTISISPQNKVVYVMNTYQANTNMSNVQPSISEERAYQLAYNYLNVESSVMYRANRLMVYKNTKIMRLAHEVTILTNTPAGEWHVFVDARSGEIFKVVDLNHYYCDKEHKHDDTCEHDESSDEVPMYRRVDGTGMVFNPDPLSSNQVAYGGQYVDNNDATNATLDAARFSVTLRDITLSGSTYSLVGPRAQIVDFDAPSTGLFTQNSPTFNFNRQDQGFEPVNTYYHIDFLMGYINETLGCNVLPYQYAGGVKFDPHGAGGADNSYYTGGTGQLSFGEGCVDDAEDSDVIHHELGHGLHDWVTSGGLSQVDGLSEGSGDYVAQSYNRSLGNWSSGDAAYNYVFNWDGHNPCWPGRTTNYGATYPGGLVGQIHADGQIWATCLMTVWDLIGQQEMDKIFYEGLGMTNGGSSQNDAANAVYQAAINLGYTTPQLVAIHNGLSACGYTLPNMPGPPTAAIGADRTTICLDDIDTVNFTDESVANPAATAWSWTFEGGTPGVSTDQNPVVTYAAEGTYDVTLMVTNPDGNDTVVLTDYITVNAGANCSDCVVCASVANTDYATGTQGVIFNTISNLNTGKPSGYSDYTAMSTNVNRDEAYDLTVNANSDGNYQIITYVWIDWNQNCSFDDAGELYDLGTSADISNNPTVNSPLSVTVPVGAFLGATTMRVTTKYTAPNADDFPTSCEMGHDAEVEDYTVVVEPSLSIPENTFDEFSIFPNPNNGEFTINLSSRSNKNINVEVYDIRGRSIFNNTYDSTSDFSQSINLNSVQSGMYLVKVTDGDRIAIKKIIVN